MSDKLKTIRVRIVVGFNDDGDWWANGYSSSSFVADSHCQELIEKDGGPIVAWRYIEADVPLPYDIEGEVVE